MDLKQSFLSDPFYGLTLTLYVNVHEKLLSESNINATGAIVRISNSSYLTDYAQGGVFISPGTSTFIAVNREFQFMLPRPYSQCEIEQNSSTNEQINIYTHTFSKYFFLKKFLSG